LVLAAILLAGCGEPLGIVRGPNRNVNKVEIEVDWTTPQPPSDALLRALEGSMGDITADGVEVVFILGDDLSDNGRSKWTKLDRRAFAVAHKDVSSRWYFVCAGGVMDEEPAAGGVAWNTRDAFVFPDRYYNNGGGLQQAMLHEWCHTLGLVNDQLKMQRVHESTSKHHCGQHNCLMKPYSDAQGTRLCEFCVEDLEAGEEK